MHILFESDVSSMTSLDTGLIPCIGFLKVSPAYVRASDYVGLGFDMV